MKNLLLLAVLLLAGGCGVKPTPVIQAGPAPTIRDPASGAEVILYFVLDSRVTPVARPTGGATDALTALQLLLKGPTGAEASSGYTTTLPATTAPGHVDNETAPTVISLPYPVRELTSAAINQLVCTATAATAVDGTGGSRHGITVTGSDGSLDRQTCQAF